MVLSIVYSRHHLDQEEAHNRHGREVTPGNPSSVGSWNTFLKSWVKYCSLPSAMLADNELESAHNFSREAGLQGIMMHTTNRMSPWENGLAEGHIGAVNDLLQTEILTKQISSMGALDNLVSNLQNSKSSRSFRGGSVHLNL